MRSTQLLRRLALIGCAIAVLCAGLGVALHFGAQSAAHAALDERLAQSGGQCEALELEVSILNGQVEVGPTHCEFATGPIQELSLQSGALVEVNMLEGSVTRFHTNTAEVTLRGTPIPTGRIEGLDALSIVARVDHAERSLRRALYTLAKIPGHTLVQMEVAALNIKFAETPTSERARQLTLQRVAIEPSGGQLRISAASLHLPDLDSVDVRALTGNIDSASAEFRATVSVEAELFVRLRTPALRWRFLATQLDTDRPRFQVRPD